MGQVMECARRSAATLSIGGLRLFQDADSAADDQGAHRSADDPAFTWTSVVEKIGAARM